MTTPNARLAYRLLGIDADAPTTTAGMAGALAVAFTAPHEADPDLQRFAQRLRHSLEASGARVMDEPDALAPTGKIREDIVVMEQGEGPDEALAVRRVSSLYRNPLVALYAEPPPIAPEADLQATLDAIVGVLAWNLTHIPIFVHDGEWTVCTMNGAVIPCGSAEDLDRAVRETLVPKLAAQVKPPDPATITFRHGALDLKPLAPQVADFVKGARAWAESGLMLAHTSLDALRYRNRFYRRIVAAYLDQRTGMSYGFLARQLAVRVRPAEPLAPEAARAWEAEPVQEVDGRWLACCYVGDQAWLVDVPEVSVLCTRSGCEKTRIDPERDLVRLTLSRGRILFDTPEAASGDCRPSYDTLAILAHAVGNALAASVLLAHEAEAPFARALAADGLALAHWHGYPVAGATPEAFTLHGEANPPVSCSTPQSAAFALMGKLDALGGRIASGGAYRGDVHVEPHHGTNLSGDMTLAAAAQWAEAQQAVSA